MAKGLIDPDNARSLIEGDHSNPFAVLGPHERGDGWVVSVLVPGADAVTILAEDGKPLTEMDSVGKGLFATRLANDPGRYRLRGEHAGASWEFDDPYRFGPLLGDVDEYLLSEGTHRRLWHALGAHMVEIDGVAGTHFAVWAPNARRVSVVGDFNHWDGRTHPMRTRGNTGVWEIFLPGVGEGACYKYEIRAQDGALMPLKADPVGFGSEHPPSTASMVRKLDRYRWQDDGWMQRRAEAHRIGQPITIYEAHIGSWKKADDGKRPLSYLELAEDLVPYVRDMGFTHLELLPISEFPFDGSWGYQPIGLYAPTIRHGTPDEFRHFVEACHNAGIGLILDWVPGHFPTDQHGLGRFDGSALYEHADPREGYHPDWNTLIYNYGRREVRNYLIANALYWMIEHHVDALRVDAVASMLYRDYSRAEGDWIPNQFGGRENIEAIAFLKAMNEAVYAQCPGIMTIAEESTAWPGVSRPTSGGGLGFGFKWNMGWMNDTLSYMGLDPIHRKHHHHQMTFGLHYAFSENFILPISHDEVVHGKGSLLTRMPGDGFDKFANLRAYFGFMWGHPGKKLLFMGQEFAQGAEWNHNQSLDWHQMAIGEHAGMQRLVRDLNTLYRGTPALHQRDTRGDGFAWIDANAAEASTFAWARFGDDDAPPVVVVCNFTPVERASHRVGVPVAGRWIERLNTDAPIYGGAGRGNMGGVQSKVVAWNDRPQSIEITLPPLSTVIFEWGGSD